jgi:hypothetical protein
MAGDYLYILQGDSYSFSSNVALDGVAQNIYGANVSFYAVANPYLEGQEVLFEANTNTGQIAISGASNNQITVSLNSSFTANIPQANVGLWFLRTTTSGGDVYTLDRGRIAVLPGEPSLPL